MKQIKITRDKYGKAISNNDYDDYANSLLDICSDNLLTEYQKSIIDKMAKELKKPRERVSIYGRRRRPRK